jgi:hypothetical protein
LPAARDGQQAEAGPASGCGRSLGKEYELESSRKMSEGRRGDIKAKDGRMGGREAPARRRCGRGGEVKTKETPFLLGLA